MKKKGIILNCLKFLSLRLCLTTRTDVFDFQVLNYLKLSSNCSVIELCPCGSWYCEVCQVCHPEFFKQIYVLNLFQNQLTFLQLHLGIRMCDMHTINAQILPQLYICIFLSSKIKKKKIRKDHFQCNNFPQYILSYSILPPLLPLPGPK